MIDKLLPRQIFSLDDQSNNSTPGHQRIIVMYKPITIIHENSIIAHEVNISSMKTRKSLTLVDSKCDKTVTAHTGKFVPHTPKFYATILADNLLRQPHKIFSLRHAGRTTDS